MDPSRGPLGAGGGLVVGPDSRTNRHIRTGWDGTASLPRPVRMPGIV